jgi:hypothetical protein
LLRTALHCTLVALDIDWFAVKRYLQKKRGETHNTCLVVRGSSSSLLSFFVLFFFAAVPQQPVFILALQVAGRCISMKLECVRVAGDRRPDYVLQANAWLTIHVNPNISVKLVQELRATVLRQQEEINRLQFQLMAFGPPSQQSTELMLSNDVALKSEAMYMTMHETDGFDAFF